MKLNFWAFIYLSPGFNDENNSTVSISNQCKIKIIGLDTQENDKVVSICQELVQEGVQTIELCGGFGPVWVTKILEAINYQIPIGTVMYGPEFRKQLYELMNN